MPPSANRRLAQTLGLRNSTVTDERIKLHDSLKAELLKRQLSNSVEFDKAILTNSSAGLVLSLAFLKDFISIAKADHAWTLYASWAMFLFAVISTLASFATSQLGISKQLEINERYYIKLEESAADERNKIADLTNFLGYASGLLFISALILSAAFVSINIGNNTTMANDRSRNTEGAQVPILQRVPQEPFTRGAPIPGVQRVPQSQPAQAPAPAPAPQPSSSGPTQAASQGR